MQNSFAPATNEIALATKVFALVQMGLKRMQNSFAPATNEIALATLVFALVQMGL